jgi:hypothetical protein
MNRRNDWLTRTLPTVALVAFLVVAATTEFSLAHDVMKLNVVIAAGVPIAVDCYVVAAFRAGRDVKLAMVVTAASLAAATGWHMATSGTNDWARFGLAGLVLMLLVIVLWRVHVITAHDDPVGSVAESSPLVQVRTETITVTATRSVAYLPATYVRTIQSDRIGSDRPAIASTSTTPRSIAAVTGSDRIRSDPDPAWIGRTRIGSGSAATDGDLLADLRAAIRAADPIPTATSIREHYRIAPHRARSLRDHLKTDRDQPGGVVEGKII